METFDVKGKVALVTGSNRGIGEGFVKTFIENGVAKVYAAARNLDNLQQLVDIYGDVITPVLLDVTNMDHVRDLSKQVKALDILVNNAGIANACFSTSDEAFDIARQEMETNFFGPMQVTQALLPLLKQSPSAAIINLSSIAGISNFPVLGPYSATKAAIHSYTQGLRAELSPQGIRVVGVYPGPIDTRMAEGFEIDKPKPEQVAMKTLEALKQGRVDVLPDDFSEQMYSTYLKHPHELEKVFAEMQ